MCRVWVNEFEEQEHRGLETDSIQITRVVYPQGERQEYTFFYRMVFSYIFDPLPAVITTHHTVNLHLSTLPACLPGCECVCVLVVCVCGQVAGLVILDLAEAAQFV